MIRRSNTLSCDAANAMALEICMRHFRRGDGMAYMERRQLDSKGRPYRVYEDARIVQMAMESGASPNLSRTAAKSVIIAGVRR